ncbi:unnamed protein product [Phaeothamnion confervicola]
MSKFIREHLQMLLDTEDPEAVVNSMRGRCTATSLAGQIARVKRLYFDLNIRNESFEENVLGIYEFIRCRPGEFEQEAVEKFKVFCTDSVAFQWRKQRDAIYRSFTGNERLDAAIGVLKIVPPYFEEFKLTEDDQAKLKAVSAANLEKSSSECVVVKDCIALLKRCKRWARDPPDPYVLAASLAVLCGRRSVEILSCGRFRRCPDHEYACTFSGAAKQRLTLEEEEDPPEYRIPLLIKFDEFYRALKKLRKEIPTEGMDNARVHAIHGKRLVDGAKHLLLSDEAVFHDTRRVYGAITYKAFTHSMSINLWLKKVLIHEDLSTSVNYTRCRVDGKPKKLGTWVW